MQLKKSIVVRGNAPKFLQWRIEVVEVPPAEYGNATPNYNVKIATQNQNVTNYEAYDSAEDKSIATDFVNICIEENDTRSETVVEDAGYGCGEVHVELAKLNN